ncbi:hypothetical protein MIR68_006419 [Amoeboaphelidium protococcarum]|nr:hypothetical protein MIR68_006419 [Amoeboaphelidium protococcarum]
MSLITLQKLPIVITKDAISVMIQAFYRVCILSVLLLAGAEQQLVTKDNKFKIDWRIDSTNDVVTFGVSELVPGFFTDRWFALAFNDKDGRRTMNNVDMVFVNVDSSAQNCVVTDRWSDTQSEPSTDDQFGGVQDYYAQQLRATKDGHARCEFSRKLETGDKYDFQFTKNQTILLFYAHSEILDGGSRFDRHHKTVGGQLINLFDANQDVDQRQPGGIYLDDPNYRLKRGEVLWKWKVLWHSAAMTVAFIVLMFPFAVLARYMKYIVPKWFFHHWKGQVLATLIAIAGFIIVFYHLKWSFRWTNRHTYLGVVLMFVLIPLQLIMGYLSNALWYAGKPPHLCPDKLHWILGYVILVSSVVNIGFGVEWYQELAPLYLASQKVELQYDSQGNVSNLNNGLNWTVFAVACSFLGLGLLLFEVFVGQKHEHQQTSEQYNTSSVQSSSDDIATMDVEEVPVAVIPNEEEVAIDDAGVEPLVLLENKGQRNSRGIEFKWSRSWTKAFYVVWWITLTIASILFILSLVYM